MHRPLSLLGSAASASGGVIRIKGRNLTESEHIKLGAYHSLELELGRAFTLKKVRGKPAACWHQGHTGWVGAKGGTRTAWRWQPAMTPGHKVWFVCYSAGGLGRIGY